MSEFFSDVRYEPVWKLHEWNQQHEPEDTIRVGIGLLLVDRTTGQLYTVRELKNKEATGVKRSTISFPLETRKLHLYGYSVGDFLSIEELKREKGETIMHNTLGLLGEEWRGLREGEQLAWLHRSPSRNVWSYLGRTELKRNVYPDMVIVALENRQQEEMSLPLLSDEVEPYGWCHIEDLLGMNPADLRAGILPILQSIHESQVIPRFLEAVSDPNAKLTHLIKRGDPIVSYAEGRRNFPDLGSKRPIIFR